MKAMPSGFLRTFAIVVLLLHVLPLSLPFFCDRGAEAASANCEQPMPTPGGPSLDMVPHAVPCANPAFCAAMGSAAVVLSTSLAVSAIDSYAVAHDVFAFAPTDPQAPLPPPPQA